MVPASKYSYPLSVLETLIVLTYMVFWASVNITLHDLGASFALYVVVNAAFACFALFVTYFAVDFGDEEYNDDPLANHMVTMVQAQFDLHDLLEVKFRDLHDHVTNIEYSVAKNQTLNDALKSITELLAKMVVIAQTNDQRISELMATDQQMDTLLNELAHVDPHLLNPNAQTHLEDDPQLAAAVAAIAPPKRPARAGKRGTAQTPALTVVPTPAASEPVEQA